MRKPLPQTDFLKQAHAGRCHHAARCPNPVKSAYRFSS